MSKENFSSIKSLFEPAMQLNVSTSFIHPLATQDPMRRFQPANGVTGKSVSKDHVTGPGNPIGGSQEIGRKSDQPELMADSAELTDCK